MATTPLPATLAIDLKYTQYPGGPLVQSPPVAAALNTLVQSADRLDLKGAGAANVDFAGVAAAGAKLVLVVFEAGTAAITLDYGTDTEELKPGGVFLVYNPVPVAGRTALAINYTADSVVRTLVLG